MPPKRKKNQRGAPRRCSVHNLFLSKDGQCKRCVEESKKENDVVECGTMENEDAEVHPPAKKNVSKREEPRYNLRGRTQHSSCDALSFSDSDDGYSVVSVSTCGSSIDGEINSDSLCMNCKREVEQVFILCPDKIRFRKKALFIGMGFTFRN